MKLLCRGNKGGGWGQVDGVGGAGGLGDWGWVGGGTPLPCAQLP